MKSFKSDPFLLAKEGLLKLNHKTYPSYLVSLAGMVLEWPHPEALPVAPMALVVQTCCGLALAAVDEEDLHWVPRAMWNDWVWNVMVAVAPGKALGGCTRWVWLIHDA